MVRSTLEFNANFDTIDGASQNALENPEKVTTASQAVIDAAMGKAPTIDMPQDNGVLLAHGVSRDGALLRDAEVRELNGEDEEALAKVGVHWMRFVDTIVSRGTVSIGNLAMTKSIGDELLVGDREDLVLGIRKMTFGPVLDIEDYVCPVCQVKSDLAVNLEAIPHVTLDNPENVKRSIELRNGRVAEVRFVNGGDQKAIYADPDLDVAQSNTILLSRCIISLDGVSTGEAGGGRALGIVKKLGMADRKKILRFLNDEAPGPRFDQIEYTHDACGSVIKLPLSLGDLFLGL